jgi:hypothetical protein
MNDRRVLPILSAALCAVILLPNSRADAEDASAEAVVRKAIDAANGNRLGDFAAAMHPDALKKFRDLMSLVIDEAEKHGNAGQVLPVFPGVKNLDDVKKLSDRKLFAAFVGGVTALKPELKKALAGAQVRVLGHITEGKGLTYVIYRMKMNVDGSDFTVTNVASLRPDGTRWALLLNGDTEATLLLLKQAVAGSPVIPDFASTKVQPLGHILEEGDKAHIVYRATNRIADTTASKLNVLTVAKDEPGFETARTDKTEDVTKLIRERLGLGEKPRP